MLRGFCRWIVLLPARLGRGFERGAGDAFTRTVLPDPASRDSVCFFRTCNLRLHLKVWSFASVLNPANAREAGRSSTLTNTVRLPVMWFVYFLKLPYLKLHLKARSFAGGTLTFPLPVNTKEAGWAHLASRELVRLFFRASLPQAASEGSNATAREAGDAVYLPKSAAVRLPVKPR